MRRHYIRTSREVKRWEATSRSPVFASFSALLKVRQSNFFLFCFARRLEGRPCCCGSSRLPGHLQRRAHLQGLPTIRAYGAGARFRAAFLTDLSDNGAWWFCFITCG